MRLVSQIVGRPERRLGLAVLLATVWLGAVAWLPACDSSGSSSGHGDGGTSGGDGGKADLPAPKPCNPACTAPRTCSAAGVCIDPGTCADNRDCDPGLVCDVPNKKCVPDDQCGSQPLKIGAVAPSLLIALDRSCSMRAKVGGTSKWEIAVAAIKKLLKDKAGTIRFGLTLFPDTEGNRCTQGAAAVPVGANNETKITALLDAALQSSDPNYPNGPCVTNIDTAMQQASAEPAFSDPTRPHFVLLVTDGKQFGCNDAGGDNGTTQIIKGLASKGVSTFVVGFGGGVDPAQLNIFADAGGKPSGDPQTRYFKAEDQASLDKALANIASKTFGCVVALTSVPPTLDKIYVFFDGKSVPQDPTKKSGWDYDAANNRVTFYGQYCKDLEDGKVSSLDIVYGCKAVPPGSDGGGGGGCAPDQVACTGAGPDTKCPPKTTCIAGCCVAVIN